MNDIYKNYHKHDYYGNPWAMDVAVSPEDYCKRAVELGHDTVFTVNHGVTGNIFEWMEQSKKYNLKMCYGTEAYYVTDRFEKDNSNKHLIIIAKNNEGVMQLNDIMSEAHTTGFRRKPRIDRQLLFSLNPKNFIITTACVAGIWDDSELILALYRKFGDNFFLEIQNHNFALQKTVNQKMLKLHEQVGIPIIHANDSHYIYPEDSKYRDILLKAKGFKYDHEDQMCLDYPGYDEILDRYDKQGIVKSSLAKSALDKTNVFDECEPITLINDDIKLPQVSKTPTEDLREIINNQWDIEKHNVPKERWKEYTDAIEYELDVVEKTHMENYFLIDYIVAKNGQAKYDGRLTNTGRGCFTGNALIHTSDGIKELKNIEIGDMVLTADGTFKPVLNTMSYEIEEELIEIKHLYGSVKNHMPSCTKDHKILILRDGHIQWIEAQYLTNNDYVCAPKVNLKKVQDVIDLNSYNIFVFPVDEYICEEYDKNRHHSKNIKEDENYYYIPVQSITVIPKQKQTVYDLSVKDQHNYLLNNMIVHNSAPSFYITKLLGLTDIDRIAAPITLFPHRFMSVERILGARSLPDKHITMLILIVIFVALHSDM